MKHFKNPETGELFAYEADGSQDAFILPHLVPITDDEADAIRAASQVSAPTPAPSLSFAQLLIGLVTEGWITAAEGRAWRDRVSLPVQVQTVIAALPEGQQFAAETRALAPSEVLRNDPLVQALGVAAGKTSEELDNFFRTYAGV